VHVDRRLDAMLAQRLAHQRANRQVGDIMVVHYVEVHDIGARGEHVIDFFAESREIGGQNRRGNLVIGHGISWLQVAGNLHHISTDFSLVKMDNSD
jgi:hypothetical protein